MGKSIILCIIIHYLCLNARLGVGLGVFVVQDFRRHFTGPAVLREPNGDLLGAVGMRASVTVRENMNLKLGRRLTGHL